MSEVVDFLRKSGCQYFSTVGLDGRPKVRPFQFMLEEGGRLYFCTSNEKKVYGEMRKQPYVEICASGERSSWLRLSGKAVFVGDLGVKSRIQESSATVKAKYKTPDNPTFEAFYLEGARATIADFSGKPPRTVEL